MSTRGVFSLVSIKSLSINLKSIFIGQKISQCQGCLLAHRIHTAPLPIAMKLKVDHNGRILNVMCIGDTACIRDLKNAFCQRQNIPKDAQIMSYQGIILEDPRALCEYGITENSVISLVLPMGCAPQVDVNLKFACGMCITLTVGVSASVCEVKELLAQSSPRSLCMPELVFEHWLMWDNEPISRYGVDACSTITVVERMKPCCPTAPVAVPCCTSVTIHVSVPGDSSQSFSVEISPESTVRCLKETISTKLCLFVSDFHLMFQAAILEDLDCCLASVGLGCGSTVCVVRCKTITCGH